MGEQGCGGLPAPSFPPPSPFPSLHPHVPSTSTTIFPCTPFYLSPAQNHQRFVKHKQPLPPKKLGSQGSQCCALLKTNRGSGGVPVLCPLQTWGFGGVPHALPPLPNQSHRAGSVRATGSSPLPSPGQPPPIPSSPHVLCPLLGVAGPWGPPWPPCSSVVLCCSFRCL